MNVVSLTALEPGDRGTVSALELSNPLRQRLEDLGICPDTEIYCVCTAPSGSPKAFWVRGTVIALREETCREIFICRE